MDEEIEKLEHAEGHILKYKQEHAEGGLRGHIFIIYKQEKGHLSGYAIKKMEGRG